jgi:hypothetical protein
VNTGTKSLEEKKKKKMSKESARSVCVGREKGLRLGRMVIEGMVLMIVRIKTRVVSPKAFFGSDFDGHGKQRRGRDGG